MSEPRLEDDIALGKEEEVRCGKMSTAVVENQIGCGEMSNIYTFTLTVQDEVDGSEPLSEQGAIDYIIYRLESQSVIEVLNIVRDY
jgi:hypothetical protein